MDRTPKVAIIILNWNGWQDTIECLESLFQIDYPNFQVIVVDNGSTDESVEKIKEWAMGKIPVESKYFKFNPNNKPISEDRLVLLPLKENLGFARGNNEGIRYAIVNFEPSYILILNNDTVVKSDFLDELVYVLEKDFAIGVASSKVMFYHKQEHIWFAGGSFYFLINKPFHFYYAQQDIGQIKEVSETEWVSGCCMFVNRKVFEKIGLFDEDYFNNYEDVDFCVRARKVGYRIVVVPKAKIYHKFAASMGGKFSPFYTYFRTRNNLLFFKKSGLWLPLILNLVIFSIYSTFESLRNGQIQSIKATFIAIRDFLIGKYGFGSAGEFVKAK
ncbi:MAG: glycosyltransferase family 2 protein [Candidatus Margulisiibacteriota bacterium]